MAKRGRPPVSRPTERINLRVPIGLYDVLCREALRRDLKVSVLSRRILAKYFLSPNKSQSDSPA